MQITMMLSGKTTPRGYGLGWMPDLPDHRDHLYAAHREASQVLPASVDLEPLCPPVYNQLALGACTGNAIAAAVQFDEIKQGDKGAPVPSRLFIYYNERVMENTVASDAGAMIRDGIKSVATQGVPPETDWPYDISRFTQKPPDQAYADAKKYEALSYQRITRDLGVMKACLAAGFPFVFGFSVYQSFESAQVARTGVAQMPARNERLLGGHAVMAIGYDEAAQRFKVRNSWGTGWGMEGYFTLPYAYFTSRSFSSDFWIIRTIGAAA